MFRQTVKRLQTPPSSTLQTNHMVQGHVEPKWLGGALGPLGFEGGGRFPNFEIHPYDIWIPDLWRPSEATLSGSPRKEYIDKAPGLKDWRFRLCGAIALVVKFTTSGTGFLF